MGEDCGRLFFFFHDVWVGGANLFRLPLRAPDEAALGRSLLGRLRFFEGLLLLLKSSENMGAVRGEELTPLLECRRLEVVEALSEMVSLLDAGRLRRSRSSTCGSMTSRLMCSQPFWILTLARARRSCRARVICRRERNVRRGAVE